MNIFQDPPARSRERPRPRTTVGNSQVPAAGLVALVVLMVAAALFALYGLWRFWPAPVPASASAPAPATATFSYFNWHLSLTRDQQFFVVVALAGVVGAMVHGLRSLSTYIGERYLFLSWTAYYALLPFVGGLLATIVYLVLRAGLLPAATAASQPDPYGVAAIAALVGLFSAQAAEKLKDVFETLFTKAETGSQSVTDTALPVIAKFDPPEGQPGMSVVIDGDNLRSVTGVAFTGAEASQYTIESEERLTVTVPAGATTGPIILRVDQQQVASDKNFKVSP